MNKSFSTSFLERERKKHKRSTSDPIFKTQPNSSNIKNDNLNILLDKINKSDKNDFNEFKTNFSLFKCFGFDIEDSTCNMFFKKYLKDLIS